MDAVTISSGKFFMAETESKSAAVSQPLAPRNAGEIIIASATEALESAVVLWLLGGVAVGIASQFAGDMIPSLPPGFEGRHFTHPHGGWHRIGASAFVLFFAIFFAHSLWEGFHKPLYLARRRIPRILSNLREHWFGLIVWNAINAWIVVLMLRSLPGFSVWQMVWQWVWEIIQPVVGEIARFIAGDSTPAGVDSWMSWYKANHLKLTFWVIYFGGAFDDLGVPNYKTLARWAWRKWKKRKQVALPASAEI